MTPALILLLLAGYFVLLILISWLTRDKSSTSFYDGGKKSPWYLVAFGMIGASLSGVTFISVPGWVGATGFGYMQTVLGYMVGYVVISQVLIPLYYRRKLTSIYTYLQQRFGMVSYKMGALFFLLSRIVGASLRLFLVAEVLHRAAFHPLGLGYEVSVAITIALIYTYTFKGGIKTIVYTDAVQTLFMLLAVVFTVHFLFGELDWTMSKAVYELSESQYTTLFNWDWRDNNFFFKQFLGGAFIATVMTGLDQDMMQKNLSIENYRSSQRNIYLQMGLFIVFNLVFLSLGAMLYTYAETVGLTVTGDGLFPEVALRHASPFIALVFVLGLIAAAYSSADSALTALTTSFCVDFLGFERKGTSNVKTRRLVHLGFSVILFLLIIKYKGWQDAGLIDRSVINTLFTAAGFTYGPLLGLFSFGILSNRGVQDRHVWWISILAIGITAVYYFKSPDWWTNYKPGFEVLIINGLITFAGLYLISYKNQRNES